jgi:hypothetical protein
MSVAKYLMRPVTPGYFFPNASTTAFEDRRCDSPGGDPAGLTHLDERPGAVVGAQDHEGIAEADGRVDLLEEPSEMAIETQQLIHQFMAVGSVSVADVIGAREAHGEHVGHRIRAQLVLLHGFDGELGQHLVGEPGETVIVARLGFAENRGNDIACALACHHQDQRACRTPQHQAADASSQREQIDRSLRVPRQINRRFAM